MVCHLSPQTSHHKHCRECLSKSEHLRFEAVFALMMAGAIFWESGGRDGDLGGVSCNSFPGCEVALPNLVGSDSMLAWTLSWKSKERDGNFSLGGWACEGRWYDTVPGPGVEPSALADESWLVLPLSHFPLSDTSQYTWVVCLRSMKAFRRLAFLHTLEGDSSSVVSIRWIAVC